MISIRPAVESDIKALFSLDLIAHDERREFIGHSVASGTCLVAVADEKSLVTEC